MPLDNDLVKKMSRLLEEGNTLLDEYCPKCGTPLFFIKAKKMRYCPKCNVYYVKESEVKEKTIKDERLKEKGEDLLEVNSLKKEFLKGAYTLMSSVILMAYKALKENRREDVEFYMRLLLMLTWSVDKVED